MGAHALGVLRWCSFVRCTLSHSLTLTLPPSLTDSPSPCPPPSFSCSLVSLSLSLSLSLALSLRECMQACACTDERVLSLV